MIRNGQDDQEGVRDDQEGQVEEAFGYKELLSAVRQLWHLS